MSASVPTDPTPAHPVVTLRGCEAVSHCPDSRVVLNGEQLELVQMLLPTGCTIDQRTAGDLAMVCVAGEVRVDAEGTEHRLTAGQVLGVSPHARYVISADRDSSLLLAVGAAREVRCSEVDEASADSFPASDAPSWTGATA